MLSRKKPLQAKRGFKAPSSALARSTFKAKRKPMPKKTSSELGLLVDVLERIFSKYIRLRYADHRGVVKCFTCDAEDLWVNMQNGHFMPRKERGTSFDEVGCQVQCAYCNEVAPNGNRKVFAQRLDAKYGTGTAERLTIESKRVMKHDRSWYSERIAHYVEAVKKLEGR